MKKRNKSYEDKFGNYLFSFDFETHKEICENINVDYKSKGKLTDSQIELLKVIKQDVETLDINLLVSDNKYYYDLIINNLNDLIRSKK